MVLVVEGEDISQAAAGVGTRERIAGGGVDERAHMSAQKKRTKDTSDEMRDERPNNVTLSLF